LERGRARTLLDAIEARRSRRRAPQQREPSPVNRLLRATRLGRILSGEASSDRPVDPPPVAGLQKRLRRDDLVLSVELVADDVVVLWARRDGVGGGVLRRRARELSLLSREVYQVLACPDLLPEPTEALRALGSYLFTEARVPLKTRDRVFVSAPGELSAVPLGLLPLRSNRGCSLLEHATPVRIPSWSCMYGLRRRRRLPREPSLLCVGDPAGTSDLGALPASAREVRAVARAFSGQKTVLMRDTATEAAVRRNLVDKSHVHIACHGVYVAGAPHLSYLDLAPDEEHDGPFRVEEIEGLALDADCVVLSACVSGQRPDTAGDDALSLGRAFLAAGARAAVSCAWVVADDAMPALMQDFYIALQRGRRPGEALADAQLKARTHKRFNHPFFWASLQAHDAG